MDFHSLYLRLNEMTGRIGGLRHAIDTLDFSAPPERISNFTMMEFGFLPTDNLSSQDLRDLDPRLKAAVADNESQKMVAFLALLKAARLRERLAEASGDNASIGETKKYKDTVLERANDQLIFLRRARGVNIDAYSEQLLADYKAVQALTLPVGDEMQMGILSTGNMHDIIAAHTELAELELRTGYLEMTAASMTYIGLQVLHGMSADMALANMSEMKRLLGPRVLDRAQEHYEFAVAANNFVTHSYEASWRPQIHQYN